MMSNFSVHCKGLAGYSSVSNKSPPPPLPRLLIFEFFSNRPPMFIWIPRSFIIQHIFLLTCAEIDDLNTNIPIPNFQ